MNEANPSTTPDAVSSTPPAEGEPGEGQSLDDILKSFDTPATGDSPPSTPPVTDDKTEITALREELADVRIDLEMPGIIAKVKGELTFPDDLVKNWVTGRFTSDQRLLDLWANRKSRPAEFDKVLETLGVELAKGAPQSAPEPTPSGSLAAAVRSARTATPTTLADGGQDWSGMGDQEFATESRKILKQAEAGTLTPT